MLFFHSLPVPELWEWFFFIPFPFPNCGNGFFSFPSRSRILGIDFFIPFPFPNFGNGFFSFPSRSRIEGMGFFNSLPVPELREWNYPFPFPFPNSQMSFPLTPARENGRILIHGNNTKISFVPLLAVMMFFSGTPGDQIVRTSEWIEEAQTLEDCQLPI